jgi:ribosomal protein S18 acetylase RimI-like enzyme
MGRYGQKLPLKRGEMSSVHHGMVTYRFLKVPAQEQIRQIIELYRAQGWLLPGDDRRDQLIPRLITGSHCFAIATDGERIVGMGRAISDGISDAYIQDLTVHVNYRNRGIGEKILMLILERLHGDGILWIGLIAVMESCNLYRRAGFKEMSMSVPMLMIKEP